MPSPFQTPPTIPLNLKKPQHVDKQKQFMEEQSVSFTHIICIKKVLPLFSNH